MLQNAGALYILTCKCASSHSGMQFLTSDLQKVARTRQLFHILTCKCASRHSGVPFLNISTWKSGPRVWCFAHFDVQMRFAPQRRAIFEHRNFKNGSDTEVFCAFWLAHVLRATAAYHFWTSEVAKLVRACGVLCILTWKGASRSAVPFFICVLNSYLRTHRFSEATFRTSGTTNHWKNTAIRDVPSISRTCTCFLLTLHACLSSFCWLDISTLLDTSTLLFNSAYCRKLGF